jgi:hypothetical protein
LSDCLDEDEVVESSASVMGVGEEASASSSVRSVSVLVVLEADEGVKVVVADGDDVGNSVSSSAVSSGRSSRLDRLLGRLAADGAAGCRTPVTG